MTGASEIVGKESKVSINDFAAIRGRFKRMLHKTKVSIQEVIIQNGSYLQQQKEKEELHRLALESRKANKNVPIFLQK